MARGFKIGLLWWWVVGMVVGWLGLEIVVEAGIAVLEVCVAERNIIPLTPICSRLYDASQQVSLCLVVVGMIMGFGRYICAHVSASQMNVNALCIIVS